MVGGHHATSQFASEVGVGEVFRIHLCVLVLAQCFGSDDGREASVFHDESILVAAWHVFEVSVPKAIGIVAIQGQHLAKFFVPVQFRPASACVERCVESCFDGHSLQCLIVTPRAAAFVLDLHTNNGTTVFPKQTFHLCENVFIQFVRGLHKAGSRGAQLVVLWVGSRFVGEPYGEAALIYLAVAERAYAQHYRHADFLACFYKLAQVFVSLPIPLAFLLFMVNPKDVGGKDGDATSLHLQDFAPPVLFWNSCVVDFAHDGQNMSAVDDETSRIYFKRCSLRVGVSTKMECLLCVHT